MRRTLREHWPEDLIEAWGLGTFMGSASVFATQDQPPRCIFCRDRVVGH